MRNKGLEEGRKEGDDGSGGKGRKTGGEIS